jgi:hypothetical protein
MTTKLVKWESEHGQMAKIRPSVACGGRNTTTAAQFEYDRHGFEGYLGNVGLNHRDDTEAGAIYWIGLQ